jgi:hypothetical protein
MPASGYCLQFVRECFDVAACYGSAIEAWNASQYPHPGDRNIPPGVPVYFLSPSVYDHVVFGVSSGELITTFNEDIRSYGGDAIAGIERDFDAQYLGWAEDINRVRVYDSGAGGGENDNGGFLMALSDQEQIDLYNRVANIAGWVYAGGPDVNSGAADPGSLGARMIHVDQQVAGAQNVTPSVAGRVINIDQQLTGADGAFNPSLGTRIVRTDENVAAGGTQFSSSPWRGVVAVLLALAVAIGFVLAIVNGEQEGSLPAAAVWALGGSVVGGLLTWLVSGLRGKEDDT